jgi:hypothetical protein
MRVTSKRIILILFLAGVAICSFGLIIFIAFGIGSSDYFVVNGIKKSLQDENNQEILLAWVDETFRTHELTEKLAAISYDDTSKGIMPGKKICHQTETSLREAGVWAKEVRLLKSSSTGEYTAVYLGNARFGTIIRLSYVTANDIGLNFNKQYVTWHKDRIYIIIGPLFVAGKQNNGVEQ